MAEFIAQNQWIIWVTIFWVIPWKGVALWKSARLGRKKWFIALLILNTLAVLEILYIFVFDKKKNREEDETNTDIINDNKNLVI